MSKYKCKGCQWYNKPYWSIINPCDNCPRENTNVEIITRWQDPTIEELKNQLQQKENIIKEVREHIKGNCILSDEWEELENHNFVPIGRIKYKSLSSKEVKELLEILDKEVN